MSRREPESLRSFRVEVEGGGRRALGSRVIGRRFEERPTLGSRTIGRRFADTCFGFRLPVAILLAAAWSCAPEPEITLAELSLRWPVADTCRPVVAPTELLVEALGDFPASDARTIELLRVDQGAADIDRFPAGTRVIAVRARSGGWDAVGARLLSGDDQSGSLVLAPIDRSCPSPDPALALAGGASAALPDGSLALAGGLEDGLGTRRLAILRAGEPLADVLGGLAQRRVGHALIANDDELWVLGGALGVDGPAHDTWERFSAAGDPLDTGVLAAPRRDFGAARLSDGRIVLVGGRSTGDGEPLGDAEILDPARGTSRIVEAPFARLSPQVVVDDEGHVLVIGGVGAGGSVVPSPIFVLDPTSLVFVRHDLTLPRWASFEVAPLPGARVALVGDAREGLEAQVAIVHVRELGLGVELSVDVWPIAALEGATDVRATPMPDGTLAVTARRDGAPLALRVDVGRGSSSRLDVSRSVARLVTLADGTIAELGADGASFRRPPLRTPFDNLPATVLAEDLALGAPTHWRAEGASLVAEEDEARATVASLRFASFVLTAQVEGSVDVLLGPEGAAPIAVRIWADEVGPTFCTLPREEGGVVRLERDGSRLTIRVGEDTRTCVLDGLGARVSIGFRASEGARLRGIELTRTERR